MGRRRIRRYGSQSARWDAEFWKYHHAIVGYLEYHCLTLLRDHLEMPHSADELHDEVLEPLIRRRYLIAKMGLEDFLKDRNMSRVFPELSDIILPRLEDMLPGLSHMKFQPRHSGESRSPDTARSCIYATKLTI